MTVSPTLIAFLVQPCLIKIAGAPNSISQLTILPLESLASTKTRAWPHTRCCLQVVLDACLRIADAAIETPSVRGARLALPIQIPV